MRHTNSVIFAATLPCSSKLAGLEALNYFHPVVEMANPYYGLHSAWSNQQYTPWAHQRSYPFPGLRQTGACPQHGAFYGHGGCFQLPPNYAGAQSHRTYEKTASHLNPIAPRSDSPIRRALVSCETNMTPTTPTTPTNSLSARAPTFVPGFDQNENAAGETATNFNVRNAQNG